MPRQVHAFTDDALGTHDAVALASEIAAGRVSAAEALDAALARVEAVNAKLNAVAHPLTERARAMAVAERSGVFAGVPTVIKGTEAVEGAPNRMGSRAMPELPSPESSPLVKHYETTGVVPLAITTLPEFGLTATTEPLLTGITRNPWSLDHSPGGSSGGSAALVAAGAVPIAHANDGGGSIRIPAANCGLVGLKPTRGRILQLDPPKEMPINIAVQGVVSRSVRDTAMFMHGAEQHHRAPGLPAVGHVASPVDRPLRIGVITADVEGVVFDSRVVAETERVSALCESLGHHVEPIALPFPTSFVDDFFVYWALIPSLLWRMGTRAISPDFDRDQLEPWTKHLVKHFNRNAARFPRAVRRLKAFEREYRNAFTSYDVLLSSTLARPVPRIGYFDTSMPGEVHLARAKAHVPVTPFQNVSGGPAISLPLATDADGLPMGMHFAADVGQDALLLELALQLEAASPFPVIA